jgi:hypothetical protein
MRAVGLIVVLLGMGSWSTLGAQSFVEYWIDCDAGNAKACFGAGKIHSAPAYKEKNYDSAKAANEVAMFYRKSCELGYARGCTAYAMSYAADREKDPSLNMQYYLQKACDGGDDRGCTMLKMMPIRQ